MVCLLKVEVNLFQLRSINRGDVNMNRRKFLKNSAALGLSCTSFSLLFDIFNGGVELVLPSIEGDLKAILPRKDFSIIPSAYAQNYYYNASYQKMAYYSELLAYQKAMAEWRRQLIRYQMQRYQWIQQQQIIALQNLMASYSTYQIGQPKPWNSIKSIYGFAVYNNQPTLFGVNSQSKPVAVKKTVQGAGAVFAKVGEYFGESTQEKATGPQSSESPAKIVLPNGSTLDGNGYKTEYGELGVSNDIVQTQNGKVGQLAKYKLNKDGEQYLIV